MKSIVFYFLLLLMIGIILIRPCSAQGKRTDQPWQLDLAAGVHTFYAPVEHLKWGRSDLTAMAGLNKLIGKRQLFSVGLQLQFFRHNYAGDALALQLIGQYTPVIGQRLELGLGAGVGYRFAMYPGGSLRWNGSDWEKGKSFKGITHFPLQLSLGYRSIQANSYSFSPYVSCQFEILSGYSPDLNPLPVSALMLGVKIHNNKK